MRRKVLLVAGVVGVVVIAAVAYIAWPRGADPVTEEEALDDFRSQSADEDGDATSGDASTPTPGVYTYASSGQEEVKLGVLPTETRTYPDTMSVVVVPADPSCFTATVNLLAPHTEDTTYCLDEDGGLRIDSHVKHQQVGAVSPTATMACDPDLLAAGDREPTELSCTLTLSGGPAELTATLAGTAEATDDTVTVGDEEIDAIAVTVTYEISGDLTGSWHEEVWFAAESWLPLQIERELDLEGLATFTEQSSLTLTDTEPRQ